VLAIKRSLMGMLIALTLIACQRAPSNPSAATPPPTPTQALALPTPSQVHSSPTPPPLLKADCGQSRPVVASQVPRITPSELKSMLSSARNVVVVYVRGRDAYLAAHIRGALDIPYDQVEAAAPTLSRTAKIVIYCA
jgi:hypothetical protein